METVMNCSWPRKYRSGPLAKRRASARGFSLLELVIVVAIALVVIAMAIPGINNALHYYSLRSAVSSLTGAIQSARYQAIFHGCRYQLVFTQSSYSYTVANEVPVAGSTTCSATYGTASAAIPLMGTNVTLGGNSTLQFLPNGQVTSTVGPTSPITFTLTRSGFTTETITVSNYGRINVTP
jgi:prepilin-type N-terminal cleavage/methylation domain-containing protein